MKLDTLSYAYPYQAEKNKLFDVLMDQQLKYFNYYDKSITELHEGQEITVEMKTGKGDATATTKVKILKIIPNELFQLQTSRAGENSIIQTFEFIKDFRDNKEKLVCKQASDTDGKTSQNYFFLGAMVYKMFYKSSMKKKLMQLDKMAQ